MIMVFFVFYNRHTHVQRTNTTIHEQGGGRGKETHRRQHTPCKLIVQVVLLPLSSTTTLVAAAMFES